MAAVGHRETIARKAPSRQRASLLVLFMVAAGYALAVLVFYPGYTTADARYVYADAMAWHFGDWQSPAMAVLWRLIDPIAPGSSSMFLLTAHPVLARLWHARAHCGAPLALARPCNPARRVHAAGFFFVGMVWRDVLFGVIWLEAAVLAFAATDRTARWRAAIQALALLLIALGVLLRPNAVKE